MTSGAKSDGRFGKQDFVYWPEEDAYRCPAGERLPYRYTNEEADKMLRRYWTNACKNCSIISQCTPGSERRITRWEHEHLLDAVQQRLEPARYAPTPRDCRAPVRHYEGSHGRDALPYQNAPEGSRRDGLSVLAYNLTRVMNMVGTKPLVAAIAA
jgi:hypothetical protein